MRGRVGDAPRASVKQWIPPAHCVRGGMVCATGHCLKEKMGGGEPCGCKIRCGRRPSFPLIFPCRMHHSAKRKALSGISTAFGMPAALMAIPPHTAPHFVSLM